MRAILRLAARNATEVQIAALRAGAAPDRTLANSRFHEITGEMAGNIYLLPSFHRLLIDHARISMTFYRPENTGMADNVAEASRQHDAIIDAIAARDEAATAGLAEDHWNLSRNEIERFVMPAAIDVPMGSFTRFSPA